LETFQVREDERTLDNALRDFELSLEGHGRLTASARVFAAYFLEPTDEGDTPWSCVCLDEAAEVYSALLEAHAVPGRGAKERLRGLYPSARLIHNRLMGVRWSPLRQGLPDSATEEKRERAS
jgi:hypothetical protein